MSDDLHCPWCRIRLAPPLNRWEEGKETRCGLCEKPLVVTNGKTERVDAEEAA